MTTSIQYEIRAKYLGYVQLFNKKYFPISCIKFIKNRGIKGIFKEAVRTI